MQNKQEYSKPELTQYGNVETITQAFNSTGSGDVLSTTLFGKDSGCWANSDGSGPLCVSTGS